jgi:hypothetical protein
VIDIDGKKAEKEGFLELKSALSGPKMASPRSWSCGGLAVMGFDG